MCLRHLAPPIIEQPANHWNLHWKYVTFFFFLTEMTAISIETELSQSWGLHWGDGWQYNVFLQGGRIFSLPRDVFLRSWGHLMGRAQCRAVWPNHIHGRVILVWLKASLRLFNGFVWVAPITHLGVDRNRPAAFPYRGRTELQYQNPLTLNTFNTNTSGVSLYFQ